MMNNNVLCINEKSDLSYLNTSERAKYLEILEKDGELNAEEKENLRKLKRKITNKKHYVKRSAVGGEPKNQKEHDEEMELVRCQLAEIMDEIRYLKTTNIDDGARESAAYSKPCPDRGEGRSAKNVAENKEESQEREWSGGGIVRLFGSMIPALLPASIMVILILGQIPIYESLGFGWSMSVVISITTQCATVGLWYFSEQGDLKSMKDLKVIAILLSLYVIVSNGASVFEREGREKRVILTTAIAELDSEIEFLKSEVEEYRKKTYSSKDRREKEILLYGGNGTESEGEGGLMTKRRKIYEELLSAGGPIDSMQQKIRIWTVIALKALLELSCIYFVLCLSKRNYFKSFARWRDI